MAGQERSGKPSSGGGSSRARKGGGKGSGGKGGGNRSGGNRGSGGRGQKGGNQGGKQGGKRGGRPNRPDPDDKAATLKRPLELVLARLPEVERRVIELRMGLVDGHPADLGDTARELGMTIPEAKKVEERAFERIREVVPLQQLAKYLKN